MSALRRLRALLGLPLVRHVAHRHEWEEVGWVSDLGYPAFRVCRTCGAADGPPFVTRS